MYEFILYPSISLSYVVNALCLSALLLLSLTAGGVTSSSSPSHSPYHMSSASSGLDIETELSLPAPTVADRSVMTYSSD